MGLSRISRNYEIILNNAKQKGQKDSKLKINLEDGAAPVASSSAAALSSVFNPCFAAGGGARTAGFLQRGLVLRGMEG